MLQVDSNPWNAGFSTLPAASQTANCKGLLHVLNTSEALGLDRESVQDTTDVQQFVAAVVAHADSTERQACQQVFASIHSTVQSTFWLVTRVYGRRQ